MSAIKTTENLEFDVIYFVPGVFMRKADFCSYGKRRSDNG